jgi:predicted membrane-bound spermidine synthase
MRRALVFLFALSGAASLVYEVAWTRALGLILGTSALATTAVLATFMAGLALGAAAGAAAARRTARPLALYGALELAVGAAAVALARGFPALAEAPPWLAPGLLLLPAAAMGASFPLACAAGAGRPSAATLYGWNTCGAVLGTIAAAFVLLPRLGLAGTQLAAALASGAAGLVALALGAMARRPIATEGGTGDPAGDLAPLPRSIALAAAFASGLAGLVLEVAYARILALVLGGSVYAFAATLAAFLAGIGAGSLALGAASRRAGRPRAAAAAALVLTGLAVFASGFLVPELPFRFVELYGTLGASPLLEVTIAAALLIAPALGLGASFAALLRAAPRGAEGGLYAANTAGAILGAAAGGLALVPALGLAGTLAAACAVLLGAGALVLGRARAAPLALVGMLAVVLLRPALPPSLLATGAFGYVAGLGGTPTRAEFFSQFAPGRIELAFARDGRTSTVTIERLPHVNTVYLKNNGKVDGSAPIDAARPSAADMATQVSLAAAPLALVEAPRRALVIGAGGGVTAGAALAFPLERVDLVEIEGEVLRALRETHDFDAANGRALDDPRLVAHTADARRFLAEAAPASWDAVISQPAEPWLTGVANLFTREFFALGRRALRPGGLFCQWIQLYGLDEPDLRALAATFRSAFPEVLVLRPRGAREILLLGAERPFAIDADRAAARIPAAVLARAGLERADEMLGEIVAGTADVDAFAAGARPNTDDANEVEFRAPLTRWAPPRTAEVAFEHLAGAPRGLVGAFVPLAPARRLALAEGAAAVGNVAAAEAWVRSLGDGAEVHRKLGDLAAARRDAASALVEWGEALRRDPDDRGALERVVRARQEIAGQ